MLPNALLIFVALAIVLLLRTPGVFEPALAGEPKMPGTRMPEDQDDQMPETDRAPRNWLPYGVAAVAAARFALLLTLHA